MNFPKLHFSRTNVIFLVLIVLAGLAVVGNHHRIVKERLAGIQSAAAVKAAAAKAATAIAATAKTETKIKESDATSDNIDLVVHKGQGVESPMIRQLIAAPSIIDGLPGQFTGNRNDEAAVKSWAGREAAVIALKAGLVGWQFGEQYWIKIPDTVAIKIVRDSNSLRVIEYAVSSLVREATAAKTLDTAAKFAPPITIVPQSIDLAGTNFSQVAAFNVASTITASQVPFVTKPSGDIVFSSPFAYIYDGVPPPQNG